MKAITRSIRLTPKKLNLIAMMVREKGAVEAMEILSLTPKKGAKILQKSLKSAIANAENNFKQDQQSLFIKEILVSKGTVMKRFLPASRGRSQPILKRNSHLTITLGIKEGVEKKTAEPKKSTTKVTKEPAKAKKTAKAKTSSSSTTKS